MAKYIGLKLPGTFDNLSVCMFYRFRQVQTELSDVKLGGELNHPKLTLILNMQLLLSIIGGLYCIPMLICPKTKAFSTDTGRVSGLFCFASSGSALLVCHIKQGLKAGT